MSVLSLALFALLGFGFAVLVAIPVMCAGLLLWLVTLPLRLAFGFAFGVFGLIVGPVVGVFRLVFGAVVGTLGLLLAPVVLLALAVAVGGVLLAGILFLLAPLLPLALLGLLGWGIFKIVAPRPSPTF